MNLITPIGPTFILTAEQQRACEIELRGLRRELECRRLLALDGPGQTFPVGAGGEASQPPVELPWGESDPASAQVHHSS